MHFFCASGTIVADPWIVIQGWVFFTIIWAHTIRGLARFYMLQRNQGAPLQHWADVVQMLGGGPRVVVSTAAFHARVRGSVPGLGGLKETKLFLPHPRVKVSIVGSLRDREVACSASDRQGSNFESCVWRTVSSQSSHHPQEVLLAQFSLYVHKGGLKPDSFHLYKCYTNVLCLLGCSPTPPPGTFWNLRLQKVHL